MVLLECQSEDFAMERWSYLRSGHFLGSNEMTGHYHRLWVVFMS